DVTVAATNGQFDTKNVGTDKAVSATVSKSGTDAGNYTANNTATTTANITALAISGEFTADNKTYDGSTNASVLSRSLVGNVSTDAVSLDGGTASFDTKNVGTGKTVTLSGFALSGDDADNYTLSGVATTTANINQKELTVTAVNNSK